MWLCSFFLVFFFKQKTAYEMRISDWSSDVCSSDLRDPFREGAQEQRFGNAVRVRADHPNRLPARLVAVADRTVAQHPPLQRVAVRIGIERRAAILDPGCDQDGARGDRHCGPLDRKSTRLNSSH